MPRKAADATVPTFSETIRAIIVARKLTGTAIANEAKLSPSVITRYMAGKVPNGETIDKIADVLDLRITEGRGGLRGTEPKTKRGRPRANA